MKVTMFLMIQPLSLQLHPALKNIQEMEGTCIKRCSFCIHQSVPIHVAQNQVTFAQSVKKSFAKRFFSPLGALKLFVTDEMVDRIIQSMNHYIKNKSESNFRITDLWLFFGALYYLGIMKGKNSTTAEMWNPEKGIPCLSTCKFFPIFYLYFLFYILFLYAFLVIKHYKFQTISQFILFHKKEFQSSKKDAFFGIILLLNAKSIIHLHRI